MKRKRPKVRQRLTGPIHARIASLRKELKLSQEDLAKKVGVDNTAISHWENGMARPDISRLAAVATALGITVDDLIDGEDKAA